MSCRIYLVCEDHTLDQYVVKPVAVAAAAAAGKPRAQIKVVTNPRLRGIDDVKSNFVEVATRYAAISDGVAFLLDLDSNDGKGGRADRVTVFENLRSALPPSVREKVCVVLAVQEIEVWALWGARSEIPVSWANVRSERDPKEMFFNGLTTAADEKFAGGGRSRLVALSLASGWSSFRAGCPEVDDLEAFVRRVCA